MSAWVLETDSGPHTEIYHLDGVPWHEARLPGRLHRCRPQTHAYMEAELVERCACGAIRLCPAWRDIRREPWIERNSRRRRWMETPNLGTNSPVE